MLRQLTLLSILAVGAVAYAADRPNIVFLMSEDNSKHYLKLFDENGATTPNIEKLAASGIAFDHAFSNGAVCSVARTTLATGCFGPRIATQFHRKYKPANMPKGLTLFPGLLQKAGYYTANNRKTDYNVTGEGTKVWDANSGKANWKGRKPNQPFFYKQSFAICHESSLHFPASDVDNKPTETDPKTVFVPPCYPDTPLFRYTLARYHDKMMAMDAQIGAVVDQLEKEGLLEDTFIFYFGDHGGVLPASKGYAWERGLHVPFVVRIPKNFKHLSPYQSGSRAQGFVSFVDFGPTALQLAGAEVPKQMDGVPFLGKGVDKSEVESRDVAYGYADRFDEKYDFVRTVRKGKMKYVRSYQPYNFDGLFNEYRYKQAAYREWRDLHKAGKLSGAPAQFFQDRPAEALYDVEADPWETNNLANDPAHAVSLRQLRGHLTSTLKSWPDLSFFPENVIVNKALGNAIKFGQDNKARINKMVDVANLSLKNFAEARSDIGAAIASEDPFVRYWGLVTSTTHGKQAGGFAATAKKLAANDDNLLVRTRAAEFLGITGTGDPIPAIKHVLATSNDPVEALLACNTAVLLQDGPAKVKFNFKPADFKHKKGLPGQRMAYLSGMPSPKKRKK